MLQIPTKALILVAALVWLAAGASVISAGITATDDPWTLAMAIVFFIVFVAFLILFLFIARKHIKRICGYSDKLTSLFKFFDAQSYIIVAVMVFLGATIRISQMVPGPAIASFYCGLGTALIISAAYYLTTYIAICEELVVKDTGRQEYGSPRYIITWTIVVALGLVVEFFSRFLGYENNPLAFYHPLIPAFTGISAALIILAAYFFLMSDKTKKDSLRRRNGVMIVLLGLLMLGSFFIFKEIMPLIFG